MIKKGCTCDVNIFHEKIFTYVFKTIPPDNEIKAMTKLLKAFSDTTRLSILCALNAHEMCVCDLASLFGSTKSAISHQLKILRENNLVKYKKIGKHSYYSLADNHVKDILNIAKEHINE